MDTAHEIASAGRGPDTRLASYGTLAPGQVNHHQLSGLQGTWRSGTVTGRLLETGWAVELGYPMLVLDPLAGPVAVSLFESEELPAHWARLDAFEGSAYQRVTARVQTPDGQVKAWIYVDAEP